jgi:hypothetical protein
MREAIKRAVADRARGKRPSLTRAAMVAVAAGAITTAVTYRAMRS